MSAAVRAVFTLWFLAAPVLAAMLFTIAIFGQLQVETSLAEQHIAIGMSRAGWMLTAAAVAAALSAYWPLFRLRAAQRETAGRLHLAAVAWPALGVIYIGAGIAALYG